MLGNQREMPSLFSSTTLPIATAPILPSTTKAMIHGFSIIPLAVLLFVLVMLVSQNRSATLAALIASAGVLPGVLFLYFFAGGFEWTGQRPSVLRIVFFFMASGLLWGLLLWGYWYIVRLAVAKAVGKPFQDVRGSLF